MPQTLRVGDVFAAACPSCSPEKPVRHAVRQVTRKGPKFAADTLCLASRCYRSSIGSLDPSEGLFHVTWLDYHEDRKPDRVKTESFPELTHDPAVAASLLPPAEFTRERRKAVGDAIAVVLQRRQYTRKRQLETQLGEMFPEFAAVNMSDRGEIRLAFPEVSGVLKDLRLAGRIRFGLDHGRHIFGKGRVVRATSGHSAKLAMQRLREHRVKPGPLRVTLCYYVPVADLVALGHFFQAVFPAADVATPFHRVRLTCAYGERKAMRAGFRTGDTDCELRLTPNRMTITASLQEVGFALSAVKLLMLGNVLAREVVCAAHMDHAVLSIRGRPVFPATVLIHNQLPHSDALWRTEFSNIHRSFHGFPEFDPKEDRSISKRVILSHRKHRRAEFPPELVEAHLEQFRLAFLREYIGALGTADEYVPPSILRAYAPKGEEADRLVAELTAIYEERLKKLGLDRQKGEQRVKLFLARMNFWQSLIVMLFAVAAVTEAKEVMWGIAGLSVIFVAYLFWETVWRQRLRSEESQRERG